MTALITPQREALVHRVAFWYASNDLRQAAARMRAALLMPLLAQRGVAAEWLQYGEIQRYDCVVVSRRYDDDTVRLLRQFKHRGGRVVLDLCDNHFLPSSQQAKHLHRVDNLRALAELADVVVTASAALAQIVTRECPAARRVVAIGDMPDDLRIVTTPLWQRALLGWQLARERAHLARVAAPGVCRLVWFGYANKRQKDAGMEELTHLLPTLAALGRKYPLHLSVISNNAARYQQLIAPALLSSRYIEWHASTFDPLLSMHHVALIPASAHESTACRSDNRVLTALRAGLAVVADPVPSYAPYGDVIQLGAMENGVWLYVSDPARRSADAARGQAMVAQAGHAEQVLAQWLDVFAL